MNIKVEVRKIFTEPDELRAVTTVTLDDMYVVHGVKVLERRGQLVMAMPGRKFTNKEGKPGRRDIFHPITTEARALMQEAVLTAYDAAIHNPNNH